MKKRILFFLLILVIFIRIFLNYELSINSYKKQSFGHSVYDYYDDGEDIRIVPIDRKVLIPIILYSIYRIIVLFISLNKDNTINFIILRLDKRKQIYSVIISKIQGSIYKDESLILGI